jgi:hypothetical protein
MMRRSQVWALAAHVLSRRLTVDRVVDPGPFVGQLHLVGLGISLLSDTVAENVEYTSKQISERVCLTDNLCEGYFSLIALLMKASTAWSTSVTSCAYITYQFRVSDYPSRLLSGTDINGVLLGIQGRLVGETFSLTVLDHLSGLFAEIDRKGEVFVQLSRIQGHGEGGPLMRWLWCWKYTITPSSVRSRAKMNDLQMRIHPGHPSRDRS